LVTGRKLLLADDSATIRKVVELTFSDEGLEVFTVGDGQQALEKLDEVLPDIVLADVFMPELNGYQVCEHIKRTERFRHIPVMLLVGSFEPFDEAEARRVGADDYLTKPFQSIRALVGKVRDLLSGGGSSNDATTRKLTLPPEAEQEANLLDEDFIKRSTADTAPLQEQEHEEPLRSDNTREGAFTDLSMDDQMIEETPADDYGNAGGGRARDEQGARPTATYSAADLREAGISQAVETESAPEPEVTAADTYAPAQTSEPMPAVAAGGYSPAKANLASSRATTDDALLDLGDIEPPTAATIEADDFFLDLLDEPSAQARTGAPAVAATPEPRLETTPASSTAEDWNAQTRSRDEADTVETQVQPQESFAPQVFSEESSTGFALAEAETSPLAQYQSAQEAPRSAAVDFSGDSQLAPTERLSDSFSAQKAPSEMARAESGGSAASASNATGQITLAQLSPEVIDAIARRAVEQLSERVVEQIAWEVVPDLAELLIRRRLEERKE
jgi:CheY-like chemotaxis protein